LASVNKLRLVPRFARSVGVGSGFFPPERRLGHRAVHRQPAPVHPDKLVVVRQPRHPRLLEHACFGPFHEAPMRRGAGADARRFQRVPLAARAQHEKDRCHRVAIGHARVVTAEQMRLARRNQRPDALRSETRLRSSRCRAHASRPGDPRSVAHVLHSEPRLLPMGADDLRWAADSLRLLPNSLAIRAGSLPSDSRSRGSRGRARASLPDDLRSRTRSLRWRVGS
jgi:hypothetical protein